MAILAAMLPPWAQANPGVRFTVAGPPLLAPLFGGMGNVDYLGVKKSQPARDIYRQLAAVEPDAVADLHVVNRVLPAMLLFRLRGVRVRCMHKGRASRWCVLLRARHRWTERLLPDCLPRRPQWQRYAEVLRRLGLNPPDPSEATPKALGAPLPHPSPQPPGERRERMIGIAPFAQHRGKMWPMKRVEALVATLAARGHRVLLFGSRDEAPQLEALAERVNAQADGREAVRPVAGRQTFADELGLIGSLDLMVSMDSANMHFASALGVPVVSIWGATHPDFGFYGIGQDRANALCAGLRCQPCSAFGQRPCRHGDYRCLAAIAPEAVAARVEAVLDSLPR